MSEPYDNLLEDADEVIEHLGEVIERLKTRVDDQHSLILGQKATIKALGDDRNKCEARIAELEGSHASLVADQLAVARLLNDVGIEHSGYKNQAARVEVLIERLRTSQRNVISIAKERNELEAKLATSEELAEQHLAEIDSLERQFRHLRP